MTGRVEYGASDTLGSTATAPAIDGSNGSDKMIFDLKGVTAGNKIFYRVFAESSGGGGYVRLFFATRGVTISLRSNISASNQVMCARNQLIPLLPAH